MQRPIASLLGSAAFVRSSRIERMRPIDHPRTLYKGRARIEQAIGKLKRFKRIALRCDKTAQSYAAFVALACTFILVKSVHAA
jgi:transposase